MWEAISELGIKCKKFPLLSFLFCIQTDDQLDLVSYAWVCLCVFVCVVYVCMYAKDTRAFCQPLS